MDFWVAAGSIGGLAAALIAYLQYRHSRKIAERLPSQPARNIEPPFLNCSIVGGAGRYPLPNGWQVPLDDPKWIAQQEIADNLSRIHFAIITLENRNSHSLERISVQTELRNFWCANVEWSSLLAKSAVRLSADDQTLGIKIDDMPAREKIVVSVMAGSWIGSSIRSTNSAVKIKMD